MSIEDPAKPAETKNDTAIASIGESMAKMRLMIGRRYIGTIAVARIGAGMEISHLDVLGVVRRLMGRVEITIGTIAEQMRIDQSRASRVVAELVKRGELRREISQEDARRTIVTLTQKGAEILGKTRDIKQEILTRALSDWREEDIANFARLYEKFTQKFYEGADQDDTIMPGDPVADTDQPT